MLYARNIYMNIEIFLLPSIIAFRFRKTVLVLVKRCTWTLWTLSIIHPIWRVQWKYPSDLWDFMLWVAHAYHQAHNLVIQTHKKTWNRNERAIFKFYSVLLLQSFLPRICTSLSLSLSAVISGHSLKKLSSSSRYLKI